MVSSTCSNTKIISSEPREKYTTSDDLHVKIVNKAKESRKLNPLAKCFITSRNSNQSLADDKHYSRDHMFVTHIYIMFSIVLASLLIYFIIRNTTPTIDSAGTLEIPSKLNSYVETLTPSFSDFVSISVSPRTNFMLTALDANSNGTESPMLHRTPTVRDGATPTLDVNSNGTESPLLNRFPIIGDAATPVLLESSVMNSTPIVQNIVTPVRSASSNATDITVLVMTILMESQS